MRIDSHIHFLEYHPDEHIWITERLSPLKKTFMPHDLKPLLDEASFDGCIAIQCRKMLKENDWLLTLAKQNPWVKGIVGWVDLCSDEVENQLKKLAQEPLFKGVRHVLIDEGDERFLLREDFQRGIALLKEFNFTYDWLIFPSQIPYAIEVVEHQPNIRFVINHLAFPNIKDRELSPWKENIQEIAKYENVFCKLSGMEYRADWQTWKNSDFIPYLDVVFEAFGENRLIFGSNWPVSSLHGNYSRIVDEVTSYIKQFSKKIQDKVMGENCVKFYEVTAKVS